MIPLKDDIPSKTFPFVTITIIVINIIIFIYQVSLGGLGERFLLTYGAIPLEITRHVDIHYKTPIPFQFTILSSMFMHGGFLHIGGNMLYLWIFGDNVEDAVGHFKFFVFYLLCGVIAAYAHILTDANSPIPMVGASGAISGVLGAYLLLYPYARVLTLVILGYFFRFVKIPAVFVLGFWIIIQFLYGTLSLGAKSGGGIAWFAHIGGFVAGVFLIPLFKKPNVKFWRGR